MQKNNDNYVSTALCIALIVGVLSGSLLYLYLCIYNSSVDNSGLSQYSTLGILSLNNKEIVILILRRRIPQLFFIFLFFHIFQRSFVIYGSGILFGTYYGYSICQMFSQFGIKGVVYNLICFFPHYICYGTAIFFVAKWYGGLSPKEVENNLYVKKSQYLFKIFVIFFLLFFGVFWEIKFQKNILKNFYQYLES